LDHYWLDLPGPVWFSGANLYRRFVESVTAPAVAVELGAWKGRSACFMGVEIANSGKPIRFTTIDHWRGSAGEEVQEADPDIQSGRLYEVFLENIRPVAERMTVMREDTVAAATTFADGSIDFLYIDANHSYESVLRDLAAWYPKVKTGGLIAGDDWCFPDHGELGVRGAVQDFFGPSLPQVVIEPGSPPNENWLQWSIVKRPGMALASAREMKGSALRRKLVRPALRLRHWLGQARRRLS
jgi:Methyltransferase domain